VWYHHYYKLLNSNGNTSNQPYVESIINDSVHCQSVFSWSSALDVKHAINKLKMDIIAVTYSITRCKVNTSSMRTLRLLVCYQCCLTSCFYTSIYVVSFWRLLFYYCSYYKEYKGFYYRQRQLQANCHYWCCFQDLVTVICG